MIGISGIINRNKAYKDVFNTPAGEIVLNDLIKFCHVNQPTFIQGDTHASAYNEGMRRVALRILGILKLQQKDIDALVQTQTINE